jgi:hypothetical protein
MFDTAKILSTFLILFCISGAMIIPPGGRSIPDPSITPQEEVIAIIPEPEVIALVPEPYGCKLKHDVGEGIHYYDLPVSACGKGPEDYLQVHAEHLASFDKLIHSIH